MAPKYSQKTAISLYRFDTEEDYRLWLATNTTRVNKEFHDIMALVKNDKFNNGYDLFVNGHSLTKSVLWLKRGEEIIEITDKSDCFQPNKQYLLKNFTRKGQGQKNVIVLEEFDLENLVVSTTDKYVHTSQDFRDWVDERIDIYVNEFMRTRFYPQLDDYMLNFLNTFMSTHQVTHKNIETILEDSHYNFRKLFSILHQRKNPNLKLNVTYIDDYGKTRENLGLYVNVAVIKKIKFNISNYEGLDIKYKSLKAYKNSETNPFFILDGSEIENGDNGPFNFPLVMDKDTKIKLVLEFENRYLDNNFIDNEENYNKKVVYQTETVTSENTTLFYVEPEPNNNLPKAYITYIPMIDDGQGSLVLDPRYQNIQNLETIDWMMANAVAQKDGDKVYLLDSNNQKLTFSDNNYVLDQSSFYGEYVNPDANIYSLIYSIESSPNSKTLRIPGVNTKGFQVYAIVPSDYSSIKFDGTESNEINRGTVDSKTYSLYKYEDGLYGESQILLEIKY